MLTTNDHANVLTHGSITPSPDGSINQDQGNATAPRAASARLLGVAIDALQVRGRPLVRGLLAGLTDPVCSVPGLMIFGGCTLFDFQRLRYATDVDSAPLTATSIFHGVLNVT